MHTLLFLAALSAQPSPLPAPLRTIVNIRAREMCTVLRESIAPAVGGVLANDRLAAEGQAVLDRLGNDAADENADDLGGAGAAQSMDNLRVENDVSVFVSNIERIEKLLNDLNYRGKDTSDAATIEAVRVRLKNVLAQQKAELNVLSFVTYSNQGRDLQAKRSPVGGARDTPPPSVSADVPPAALPDQLRVLRAIERRAEDNATRALAPIIEACR